MRNDYSIASTIILFAATAAAFGDDLPVVEVRRDNIEITQSCRLTFPVPIIPDLDGNGVVHITAPNITVVLDGGSLRGALATTPPDRFTGIGIHVNAEHVTLRGGSISGFKVGILGEQCSGSVFENQNLSDNFAQHLASSESAESATDWLWPHDNDAHEWRTKYGAGLCIESSSRVEVRAVQARRTQNGILFDRVQDSLVADCDCSFLSGWGIGLWRSSGNIIANNAFDFCVRGYSHGIYNRGQDSAGILVFEQSSNNLIARNSATHCGDGYFSFAGREAIGERASVSADGSASFVGRGCRDNILLANDFSDAAAHGVETTFSFNNCVLDNTISSNSVCGVWGGYSHNLVVAGNTLFHNGDRGVGQERGGINIEHGQDCVIARNTFADSPVGVALWWDEDATLAMLPWVQANGARAIHNAIVENTFTCCARAIELRRATATTISSNSMVDCKESVIELDGTTESTDVLAADLSTTELTARQRAQLLLSTVTTKSTPIGARAPLAGRAQIRMTEWGPWDTTTPTLLQLPAAGGSQRFDLLGGTIVASQILAKFGLRSDIDTDTDEVIIHRELPQNAEEPGQESAVAPFALTVRWGRERSQVIQKSGLLASITWHTSVFTLPAGITPSTESFTNAANAAPEFPLYELDFQIGSKSPADHPALREAAIAAAIPADSFGLRARATVLFAPGCWILKTLSDDGVTVVVDGHPVIQEWTKHEPTQHEATLTFPIPTEVELEVRWFELDGRASLRLWFESCPPPLLGAAPSQTP
ncbi:MAG: right-handed parallel beta-helix repeat-containing protein [Planctomycetota bacterium]|nr:right-handed parallel beta-helix repeat-containing protein [Planctomycetota bacterium]